MTSTRSRSSLGIIIIKSLVDYGGNVIPLGVDRGYWLLLKSQVSDVAGGEFMQGACLVSDLEAAIICNTFGGS